MHRTRHYLIAPLVLVFAALTGCTEATSSPLLSPEAVREVICVDPTGPGCDPNTPPPEWPTYPTDLPVEQVITLDSPAHFEIQAELYAGVPETSCDLGSRVVDTSDLDGGQPILYTKRSATCPESPCYPDFLNARAAFHNMLSGGLLTAATIGSAFLGPVGQGFRIYASSRFAITGLGGYATWASYNSYRVSNGAFKKCVGDNYAWFNTYTVIR